MTPPLIGGDRLPLIEAERVVLRWLSPADVPSLFEVFSDPEVMRYWSSPPLTDEAGAHRLLRQIREYFRSGELYQWGLALRGDDRVVGTCTLAWIDTDNGRAELGFALSRERWGHGYMTEGLGVLLDHAFGTLGLRRLEADVDPRNTRSIRALERLGFEREGLLRERWFVNGEIQDSLFYGLLRRDWLT